MADSLQSRQRSSVRSVGGFSTLVLDSGPEDGEPLVLLHSAGLDGREFDAFSHRLGQLGNYRIFALDQRGHGQSSAHEGDVTLDGIADDVVSLIRNLDLGKVHLLGHSVGGAVAGRVWSQARDIVKSLTIASTPDVGNALFSERAAAARRDGIAGIVEPTVSRWFEGSIPAVSSDALRYVRASLNAVTAANWASLWESFSNFAGFDEARELDALCLVGDVDQSTPSEIVRRVAASINVKTRVAVIADAPHQLFLTHPVEVAEIWHAWNLSLRAGTPHWS
jgi:pimeloyl-ACP methyl ester carboxylesterase